MAREREGRIRSAAERKLSLPAKHFDAVYTVVAHRRTAFDTLMWQVPALGLAAQAFLLTIAYGSKSSVIARCIAGGLSVVVALVAIQTMLKHRANEKTDNLILKELESAVGIWIGSGHNPHDSPAVRGKAIQNDLIVDRLARGRSVTLWVTSLLCFAAAGLTAVVLAICDASLLSG
ncbi:MAG TPA: hypothetical protein VFX44_05855 [Solirubrobacterales bacterium]|nr:hypothetical protein [Solirubrobacterales bacterium]